MSEALPPIVLADQPAFRNLNPEKATLQQVRERIDHIQYELGKLYVWLGDVIDGTAPAGNDRSNG